MKKLAILLLAVCFAAMCAVPVLAEAPHSVTTDGNAVTITIGGSVDEEVTIQIKESGGTKSVYINQIAADSDGAVFETELAVGEYTYRAYLSDVKEYVEGTFTVEEKVEPPTSEPDEEDPTEPSDDPTEPSDDPTEPSDDPTEPSDDPTEPSDDPTEPSDDPTEPSDDPTEPSDDPTEPSDDPTEPSDDPTEPSDDPTATGDADSTDGTSAPTDKDPDEEGPGTGDRGLIGPLVLMLVSGSLLAVLLILKPKAGGKYAK